jgi:hypothetical protein
MPKSQVIVIIDFTIYSNSENMRQIETCVSRWNSRQDKV